MPLSSKASSTVIFLRQKGTTSGARPPVATTVTGWPSSASIRSIRPSSRAALPWIRPLFMHSAVFLPIRRRGGSRSMLDSWAARLTSESSDPRIPGTIMPPM